MRSPLVAIALILATTASARPLPPPVIDMHLHSYLIGEAKGARSCPGDQRPTFPAIDLKAPFDPSKMAVCARPLRAPTSDDALMRQTFAMLARYNVRHAVMSGDVADVARWHAAGPPSLIPALGFADGEDISVDQYRRLYADKQFEVFAEVETQYQAAMLETRGGNPISRSPKSSTSQSEFTWARARRLVPGFQATKNTARG